MLIVPGGGNLRVGPGPCFGDVDVIADGIIDLIPSESDLVAVGIDSGGWVLRDRGLSSDAAALLDGAGPGDLTITD